VFNGVLTQAREFESNGVNLRGQVRGLPGLTTTAA
jgi:hypothetical protein